MTVKNEVIIKVNNVSYQYQENENPVLTGVSFQLKNKERTILLGPNGAGKSTLMYLILGLYTPQKGNIYFQAQDLAVIEEDFLRQQTGFIFQNPDDQVFAPTVKEDIMFGPEQFKLDKNKVLARLDELLDLLGIEHLLSRNPRSLSYGEKKRVALAGILIMEPKLILFDEPLAFLDPIGSKIFKEIMDRLCNEGKTLLIATHNLDFAAEWGERFLVLNQGRLVGDGNFQLLQKGISALGKSKPLTTRIFQGFLPEDKLPLTVKQGRSILDRNGFSSAIKTPDYFRRDS